MIKTLDELLLDFNTIIGENNTDEAIAFMENLTDTLSTENTEATRLAVEETEKKWREKYKARFLSKIDKEDEESDGETEQNDIKNFDELFKEN